MEQAVRVEIEALAMRWLGARRFAVTMAEAAVPVAVPADLARTVATTKLRAQTLEDAGYWLAQPKPPGLGLEVVLLNEDEVSPLRGGERRLKPARFRVSWVDRMDAASQEVYELELVLAELATERDAWRVVTLWDKATRKEHAKHRAALAELVERLGASRD